MNPVCATTVRLKLYLHPFFNQTSHERTWYNAVEDGTLVAKALLPRAKGLEVGGRLGRSLAIESELDAPEWIAP